MGKIVKFRTPIKKIKDRRNSSAGAEVLVSQINQGVINESHLNQVLREIKTSHLWGSDIAPTDPNLSMHFW